MLVRGFADLFARHIAVAVNASADWQLKQPSCLATAKESCSVSAPPLQYVSANLDENDVAAVATPRTSNAL